METSASLRRACRDKVDVGKNICFYNEQTVGTECFSCLGQNVKIYVKSTAVLFPSIFTYTRLHINAHKTALRFPKLHFI